MTVCPAAPTPGCRNLITVLTSSGRHSFFTKHLFFTKHCQDQHYQDKEKSKMPVKRPKEVFLLLLSHARQGTERSIKVFQELSQLTENPDQKEAVEARVFVSNKMISQIDRCFELLDESPVKIEGRLQESIAEDFRKELAEIQNPGGKLIFCLPRARHLAHVRIAEFEILTAAADMTGHYAVGVLLESCLADSLA